MDALETLSAFSDKRNQGNKGIALELSTDLCYNTLRITCGGSCHSVAGATQTGVRISQPPPLKALKTLRFQGFSLFDIFDFAMIFARFLAFFRKVQTNKKSRKPLYHKAFGTLLLDIFLEILLVCVVRWILLQRQKGFTNVKNCLIRHIIIMRTIALISIIIA